jgi:hypothetical protein
VGIVEVTGRISSVNSIIENYVNLEFEMQLDVSLNSIRH